MAAKSVERSDTGVSWGGRCGRKRTESEFSILTKGAVLCLNPRNCAFAGFVAHWQTVRGCARPATHESANPRGACNIYRRAAGIARHANPRINGRQEFAHRRKEDT